MSQYTNLLRSIIKDGVWSSNERTGKHCLTGETAIFEYNVGEGILPIDTTRKSYFKSAVAEVVGYWQGLTDAQAFADLGSPTWFANANKNNDWLFNPHRKGENDMGEVYGAIGHNFGGVNQFEKVYHNLKNGIDDRGEIITYWKPDVFPFGCLRPCMHSFQYTIHGDVLNMTAIQRSCDVPLGLNFNMIQVYCSLEFMARMVGLKAGKALHVIHHPHIYKNQLADAIVQSLREPIPCEPRLVYDHINSWEDIMNLKNMDDFSLEGYKHHPPIKYAFSE